MPGSYFESYVQIQKESAWGTAVTSGMTKIPTLVWDVSPAYDLYESQMVTGAAGAPAPSFGVKRVAGRWQLEAGAGGSLDHILHGVLGGGSNTAGVGDPFTNRYVPSATLPSFTVHASYGNLPSSKVHEVQGVKFNSVEFSGDAAQGFINVACDLIAEDYNHNTTTGVAPGTVATTVTHEPILITPSTYATTIDLGVGSSLAYCLRSFTLRIERFLTTNRICVGSDLIKEPVPQQPMKVSGTFNVEYADLAFYDALTAQTQQTTTQLKWDMGSHDIDFVMPKLKYVSISTPIQSGDVLVSSIGWIAYGTAGSGATAEPINVTVNSAIDYDAL